MGTNIFKRDTRRLLAKKPTGWLGLIIALMVLPAYMFGQTNIALNKTAVASSQASATYSPARAVDGNTGTEWRSTNQNNPWIYVDLGSSISFNRVDLRWSNTNYGSAYSIQTSDNASTWTTIKTVTGENGGTDTHTGLNASSRYIRVFVTTRSRNNQGVFLQEFAVYQNQAPTVSFTYPTNGLTINANQSFNINVSAADADGTVSKVEYWTNNWVFIGSSSVSPFSINHTFTTNGTYELRARATDNAGQTSNDAVISVNVATPDTIAPSVPASLASSSVTQNSFTLKWSASTDNVGVTSYDVYRNGTWYSNVTDTSANISGLAASTTYTMSVRAKDAAGNISPASAGLNVKTAAATAAYRYLRLVINGSVSTYEVNMREVEWMAGSTAYPTTKLTWSSTNATASQGTQPWAAYDGNLVTSFGGNINTYPSTLTLDLGASVSISPTAIVITPEWEARAMSGFVCQGSNDNSTWTNLLTVSGLTQSSWTRDVPKTFTMGTPPPPDTEAPAAPDSLASVSVTQNSFVLSWAASTDNVGVVSYEVFRNGVSVGTTADTSLNITGLSASTTYVMTVTARDAAGNVSLPSSDLNATTQSPDTQYPAAPTNLKNSPPTSSSFILSWTAATDNVGVVSYEVFRNGVSVGTTADTSINITGLSAITTYTMTVTARDAAGNVSPQSAPLAVTTSPAATTARANQLGMNLSHPGLDWGPDKPFADAMRSHRQWIQIGLTNNDPEPPLDANYWPMTDAQCLVYAGLSTRDNHGTYRLKFSGQATVTSGEGTVSNLTYDAGTNTSTANFIVSDPNNSTLYLQFTNTRRTPQSALNTGVTNISLMRPTVPGGSTPYSEGTLFRNDFIQQLAPFTTLRSLGWVAANWNQDSLWSDRTLMQHARQSPPKGSKPYGWEGRGAAYESLILLANQAQKNVWLNIPHKVSNDYLTKLAQLFRYGSDGVNPYTSPQANPVYPPLDPNLKLYVEYSNEIWNDQFSQTGWTYQQAALNNAVKFDGKTDPAQYQYLWGMRFKALKSVEMSQIFRNVFGDNQMMSRVRPVLCFQKGYIDRTNQPLTFIDAYYNKRDSRSPVTDPHPVNYYLYGAGGSFYWYTDGTAVTINNIWTNGQWDANKRFNDQWGNPQGFYDQITADAAWARQFGLSYLHYEGDQHPSYQGGDEAVIKQMHTGTWDVRLNQNTLDHLYILNQAGAELSCFLQLNGYDNSVWAVRNVANPSNSPQIDAINTFNAATPAAVNYRNAPPFTRPGGSYDTREFETPRLTGTGSVTITANGSYNVSYAFHTPQAGDYNVRVAYSTTASATLAIELNGTVIGTLNLSSSGGTTVTTTPININCAADAIHSIRLVALAGSITIQNVQVAVGLEAARQMLQSTKVDESFSIAPNPVANQLRVMIPANAATLEISDMTGRVLSNTKANKGTMQLQVGRLPAGTYVLILRKQNGEVLTRRFIKN